MIRNRTSSPSVAHAARPVLGAACLCLALFGLAGCGPKAAGPSTLAQQQTELKGGPIPPGAAAKYMAMHHINTPGPGALTRPPAKTP